MGRGRCRWTAVAMVSGWLAVPALALAAAPVFGPPAPVNLGAASDAGSDGAPRIATDGHGVWLTVWAAADPGGDDSDVLASRSSDLGITWSVPVVVNGAAAAADAFDFAPAVATDGHGLWIVVWVATNGPDTDVFVARSLDAGASWSPPAPLYADAASDPGNDERPQLASDGAGTWIVVWDSNGRYGGDRDVLLARSLDGGITWSAPAPLAAGAATDRGADQRPQLATDGAGRWMVVWASSDTLGNTKGNDFDVLVVRSSDGAATWTAPAALAANAASDQALDDRPQIATDGLGTWVAAWASDSSLGGMLGGDLDLLTARSTDAGASWSPPAALNGNAASDAGEDGAPVLATDRHGTWVAVWESNDALDGSSGDYDVVMAHSIDGGAHWASPHAVDPEAATDGRRDVAPQLATDGRGVWNVVWAGLGGAFGADSDVLRAGGRERCGDGAVDPGEQCDDGNTHGGDGCPASCEFPPLPVATPTATPGSPGGSPGPTGGTGGGPTPSGDATPGGPVVSATPSGGATPIATTSPDPAATATASPDPEATAAPTGSGTPGGGGTATASVPSPTPASTASGNAPIPGATPRFAGGLASLATAKAAVVCQRAVVKAGAQLVGKRLGALGGCARRVQRCIQTKPDDPGCLDKAGARCRGAVAGLAGFDAKTAANVRRRCGGSLALGELLAPAGLGFGGLVCDDETESLDDLIDCLVGEHACRAGSLFEVLQPRAKELMRLPGMNASTLDAVVCLPDHGGDGASVGDPAGTGKAVEACASVIVKAGTGFVRKRLARQARCVDALFTCIQLAPGNGACLAKARARCDKDAGTSAAEERKLTRIVAARCGEGVVAYATLRAAHAANLDALADACAALGVAELATLADYQQCVVRADTCRVEGLLRVEAPRVAELMAIVGRPFGSGYCAQ